jgi:hypothetical protein
LWGQPYTNKNVKREIYHYYNIILNKMGRSITIERLQHRDNNTLLV